MRDLTNDAGSSLLEVAVALPLLLLMLAVTVDLGLAYRAAIMTQSAAEAGALFGSQDVTNLSGMVKAAEADASSLTTLVPTAKSGCECSDGSSAVAGCSPVPMCAYNAVYYVEVDTVSTYTPIIPYPGLAKTMTLHGKVRLRAAR